MKQKFYEQIKEFGKFIQSTKMVETWEMEGAVISIQFTDESHKEVFSILIK